MDTLLAMDLDGVFLNFSKNARLKSDKLVVATTDGRNLDVYWRPSVLDNLTEVLSRPEVTGMFFTSWLDDPAALKQLATATGLDALVPLRAPYPLGVPYNERTGEVLSGDFQGHNVFSRTKKWWKLKAFEDLLAQHKPKRVAWLDDELPHVPGNRTRFPFVTYEKLLLAPHGTAAMLPADFAVLNDWLAMENPS